MNNKIIAVYGSLRPSCYNFDRIAGHFGKDSITPMEQAKLEGYGLYKINDSYPGVVKLAGKSVVVDLVEVAPDAYEFIRAMELGANYGEEKVTVNGKEAIVYVYRGSVEKFNLIEDGDWVNFTKSNKKLKEFYG